MRYDRRRRCGEGCSRVVDERGNYSTHVFTREAIRVIHDYKDRRHRAGNPVGANEQDSWSDESKPSSSPPLFLYLAYQAVHAPDQVPIEYSRPYRGLWEDNPQRQTYAGMLTAADEGIGNVTQALREGGLWEDTLVIFTTDNGGPTTTCAVQGSSNHPKRGGKCSVWDGGTRGDGILSGPAMTKLGFINHRSNSTKASDDGVLHRQFPHLFHVVDWMPTIVEMIGVEIHPSTALDGKSQWQALLHGTAARQEVFVGYTHNDAKGEWYGPAIRYQKWKLVQGTSGGPDQYDANPEGTPHHPQEGGAAYASYLLFDLETDPMELVNLAYVHPGVVVELIDKLKVYQQTYVPPQQDSDGQCPVYPGPVQTHLGPTLYVLRRRVAMLLIVYSCFLLRSFLVFCHPFRRMPWCNESTKIVVYE